MAHREFIDTDGRRWEVWDVHPSSVERRMNEQLRDSPSIDTPDRRRRHAARFNLPETLRHGWLAFQSGQESRRLSPIPPNWMDLPDRELVRLKSQSTLTQRSYRKEATEDQYSRDA